MRRSIAIVLAALLVLATGLPAAAITFGEVDADDTFPYVGAMIVFVPDRGFRQVCSGTLIAPTVFLTAAHCTAFAEARGFSAFVTFERVFDKDDPNVAKLIPGTMHTHPLFGADGNDDPHDIAVIVLAKAVKSIRPAALPTAGRLDELGARNGLRGAKFTAVGYGVLEPEIGPGGVVFFGNGTRRIGVSEYHSHTDFWLRMSQNDATGDGGTCFGDSGGPNFYGDKSTAVATKVIASLTITGDAVCLATNDTYRVDSASARAFLAQFVTLP